MTVHIPPPVNAGRVTKKRTDAMHALARVLWDDDGNRRLPSERSLADAMTACDPRDVWWVCEASSAGPVYLLPTKEWVRALAKFVDGTGAKRVLEVAAGDGFLSSCLAQARPKLVVKATDTHAWRRPGARQSARDRRELAGVSFAGIAAAAHVERRGAVAAVEAHKPDLVLVSWAPPGLLVERVIRARSAKLVLDISVDGDVCGNGDKTWRFHKEFVDGPLEERALCRLDERPHEARHTRATLYYGRAHADHGVDRIHYG